MDDVPGPSTHAGPQNAFRGSGAPQKSSFADDEHRRRARDARAAKVAAGAHYRRDFLDSAHWVELAGARGFLLPQWYLAPTPGQMSKWLRNLGVAVEDYKAWSGERTLAEFALRNPEWPLRAWVGTVQEALEGSQLAARRAMG